MAYRLRGVVQLLAEKYKTAPPYEVETTILDTFLYNAELTLKMFDKLESKEGVLIRCKICGGKGHHDIERDVNGSFCVAFCGTCKGLGEVYENKTHKRRK